MTGFVVRDAVPGDAAGLCDILNAIVRAGGTTARLVEMTVLAFEDWYISGGHVIGCQVAAQGQVSLGFQGLARHAELPTDWCDIGTFARRENPVRGVGAALFAASTVQARALGFRVINAAIRADNVPGLAYYAKMGFLDYKVDRDVALADGRLVDRINRRFDLA